MRRMSTAIILALLASVSSWNTPCSQTQVQMGSAPEQGYAIDRMTVSSASEIQFVREWHHDSACADAAFQVDSEKGILKLGSAMSSVFGAQNGETVVEADFSLPGKTELGAIGISADHQTVRVARGFGQSRNTMLSLIGYRAQK